MTPQADFEPIGRLERTVQPTLNRFNLNAELGLDTTLSPDAAKATAEAFAVLVRTIDLMEAQRHATRQFLKLLGGTLLLIAIFAAMAWLA